MQYITSIERLAIEDGRNQGIQQGIRQGGSNLLRSLLIGAFGTLPPEVESRLEQASPDEVEHWASRFKDAGSLEEIFD